MRRGREVLGLQFRVRGGECGGRGGERGLQGREHGQLRGAQDELEEQYMQASWHVLVQEVGLVQQKHGVHSLLPQLLHVGGHRVEDGRRGGRGLESRVTTRPARWPASIS
jgi:hypothetical protein